MKTFIIPTFLLVSALQLQAMDPHREMQLLARSEAHRQLLLSEYRKIQQPRPSGSISSNTGGSTSWWNIFGKSEKPTHPSTKEKQD